MSSGAGLALTLLLVGGLVATAVIVAPRPVEAGGGESVARDPAHQQTMDLLTQLIASSRGVIAVRPRGATPYVDLLLWLEDEDVPGVLQLDELGLISHSEVMQAATFVTLGGELAAITDETWRLLPRGRRSAGAKVTPEDILAPSFCSRWRSFEHGATRVIARGLSDMEFAWVTDGETDAPRLRISLTWDVDSVDGPDKASTLVAVPQLKISAQE